MVAILIAAQGVCRVIIKFCCIKLMVVTDVFIVEAVQDLNNYHINALIF